MLLRSTRKLEKQLKQASNYREWSDIAKALDTATGADRWKAMDPSQRYDYVMVRTRLDQLRELRANRDNHGLLFAINEGIHGNMGGMGNGSLYARARFGTKRLVESYVGEITSSLEYLASAEVTDISLEEKLDLFHRASHCYGRTGLMLSGSGSLLYFHVGVVKTLWYEGLLPSVISGSSGGAIISAIAGTHADAEIDNMFSPAFLLSEVQQESEVWGRLSTVRPRSMGQDRIREILERLVPNLTFQEAEEITGRHINVSVAPAEAHQTSRLLNAIASPNVYIHDALLASAAVPGIYPPVMLTAKNAHGERQPYLPARRWVDGSVTDDLPAKRLARLYGVNHFVVSQTNPLALPFVQDSTQDQGMLGLYAHAGRRAGRELFNANMELVRKPLRKVPTVERWASMAQSVINQQYTADINIMPSTWMINPAKLLSLRSEKEVMEMISSGERATWPKIEMIRTQTRISRTLDAILADYEGEFMQQMINSPALQRSQQLAKRRGSKKSNAS